MPRKDGLIIKLHNRRVAGFVDNKGGEDGYRFYFKRLLPDGTVGTKTIKLSDEALDAMVQIARTLKRREVK